MATKKRGFVSRLVNSVIDAGLAPLLVESLAGIFAPLLMRFLAPSPVVFQSQEERGPRPILLVLIAAAYVAFIFFTVFVVKFAVKVLPW